MVCTDLTPLDSLVSYTVQALHAGVEIESDTRVVLVGFVEHCEGGRSEGVLVPCAFDRLREQVGCRIRL